jgi:dephospho-CoA kinase
MPDQQCQRWRGKQRRIGLTGGIASGKSTAARWLQAQGLPVLDADVFAREALAPGSAGSTAVLERYGAAVCAKGTTQPASVDRAALGRIVFKEPNERQWLEKLIHPLVRERFTTELNAIRDTPEVVLVIPLLFEADLGSLCSEVWVVACDPEQQQLRLMQRDGLSPEEARARMEAQWSLEQKTAIADRVIDNRAALAALDDQLSAALRNT